MENQPPTTLTAQQLRPAGPSDAEAIHALIESAYRGPSSRAGWTTEADLLDGQRTDIEAVHEALQRPDTRILVAEAGDGQLLGCCQIELRAPRLAYFGSFAVQPGRQGGGLGRRLLAEAEAVARSAWDAETIEMTVIEQRAELIAWYERRGYRLTGERRPFPYEDERAGLPRRDDLQFVVLTKSL